MKYYNLLPLLHKDYIYIQVNKGMYGLPQAGILAYTQLKNNLSPYGFHPVEHTPGLWTHRTKHLFFTLVVDDFGVKYHNTTDVKYLLDTLQLFYNITVDWTGQHYCGLTLDWNYTNRILQTSMPDYVTNELHKFQYPHPDKTQSSPSSWTTPTYVQKIQFAPALDDTPHLTEPQAKRMQQIIGTFLYYARAVDPTMLVALGDLASQQSTPTQATLTALNRCLDYASSNPKATIQYRASSMQLQVHSDASYLSAPRERSRAGGAFFLGASTTEYNGLIHCEAAIIKMLWLLQQRLNYLPFFTMPKLVSPCREHY